MTLYYQLFYNIYTFLELTQGGFTYQTDSYRSTVAACLLAILGWLNIISFFPNWLTGYAILMPFIFLFGINFLIFSYGKRYKNIILICKNAEQGWLYSLITVLYILGTVIFFKISG